MKVFLRHWLSTDWPSALSSASLGLGVTEPKLCARQAAQWVLSLTHCKVSFSFVGLGSVKCRASALGPGHSLHA